LMGGSSPVWTKDDAEFAREYLNGVNPMEIFLLTSSKQVPKAFKNLKSPDGASLDELIKAKRLFLADYHLLEESGATSQRYLGMVVYAPFVLLYKEILPSKQTRLNVLGIQLTRYTDKANKIYTPNSNTPYKWLFAKMHVGNSDTQTHEFIWHLCNTHLAAEAFAIAHHNVFEIKNKDHNIGKLLTPHFYMTIGVNYLARRTLVSKDRPFTDRTFSPGTLGALTLAQTFWHRYWNFQNMSFPQQLADRGFTRDKKDGLEGFYYREDGFKVWDALGSYVKEVVDLTYKTDAEVVADHAIQEYAEEITDPLRGKTAGFPKKFTSKKDLVDTLQNLIWLCSVQHSAVNYAQYDFYGFILNRPIALHADMPEDDVDITVEYIDKSLPGPNERAFQLLFAYLLSEPTLDPLIELRGSSKTFPTAHKNFVAKLTKIAEDIEERDKHVPFPYNYMNPRIIATSITV